jgi:hypothetical protein
MLVTDQVLEVPYIVMYHGCLLHRDHHILTSRDCSTTPAAAIIAATAAPAAAASAAIVVATTGAGGPARLVSDWVLEVFCMYSCVRSHLLHHDNHISPARTSPYANGSWMCRSSCGDCNNE